MMNFADMARRMQNARQLQEASTPEGQFKLSQEALDRINKGKQAVVSWKAKNPIQRGQISEDVQYYQPFAQRGSETQYINPNARSSRGMAPPQGMIDVRRVTPPGVRPSVSSFSSLGQMSPQRRSAYTSDPQLRHEIDKALRPKGGIATQLFGFGDGGVGRNVLNVTAPKDYLPGIDSTDRLEVRLQRPVASIMRKTGRTPSEGVSVNLPTVVTSGERGPAHYGKNPYGQPPASFGGWGGSRSGGTFKNARGVTR